MVCGKAKKIHKEDLRSEIIWWVTVNLITARSKSLPCICQLTVVVFLCHFVPSPHFYNYYWLLFSVRKNELLEIPILDKSNWRTMSQVNPSPFFKSFSYPHVINISGIFQSTQPSGPMNWQKYSLVSYHRSSIHLVPKPQAHSHSSFSFFMAFIELQKTHLMLQPEFQYFSTEDRCTLKVFSCTLCFEYILSS